MKKKIMPVLVVIVLILLIIGGVLAVSLIKKYTPSKERKELSEYYNLTSADQVALIYNYEVLDTTALLLDGSVYLDYNFVHDFINPRFYWDANENILLYTTADELISASADSTSYLVTKSSVEYGKPIVKASSTSAWVEIDFVRQYSDFTYTYYQDPSRIVLNNNWGEINVANIKKKNTSVRELGGIKSPILCDLTKGDKVVVLEELEKWVKVQTQDGVIGYVRSNAVSNPTVENLASDFVPETFTHIVKDFEICMAWHQVTTRDANSTLTNVLADTKGINVISPTWFYLNDNNGGIANLASNDYVNYCHQQGIEVWALVSNLENPDVDTTYVLTHTSTRQNLVNQIISVAIQYNLDGINVDFEALDREQVGDSYIQFIRELSLKCANNGIVLSVDNYAPTEYTAFYNRAEQANFADYVIIMGYDEHYGGSEEAGSVASIGWVRDAVVNTLEEVPASQVVLGMPFYTRIWCTTPDADASDTEMSYKVTSKAYGMRAANVQIATYDAEKTWNAECGQNYAEYMVGDSKYQVWLEDSSSAEERLKLLDEYSLAGASFWKLGFETSDIWDTIIKYIN